MGVFSDTILLIWSRLCAALTINYVETFREPE